MNEKFRTFAVVKMYFLIAVTYFRISQLIFRF